MGAAGGPNMVEDGMVFYYDTGNGKSYQGEPTENLFPSPQLDNNTNTVVNTASITLKDFGDGLVGLEMVQATTADIVSFGMGTLSSAVSGGTYTYSSYVHCTSTGNKVKGQVTIRVDGVRYWLTNSNTWTTSVTECRHLFTPTVANQWHRVDNQITMPTGTLTEFALGGFYRNTSSFTLKIANAQLELKSHPTQFTTGTRSATEGLKDLTGNNSINLNTVSFDSNAQMTFDGTDDKAEVLNFPHIWDGSVSLETVVSWNDNSRSIIFGNYNVGANDINFEKLSSGTLRFYWNRGERDVTASAAVTYAGALHHVAFIRDKDSNSFKFYVDGELVQTTTNVGTDISSTGSTFRIGADTRNGDTVHNGDIPVLKLYNRALTAAEVQTNFNGIRKRFGI